MGMAAGSEPGPGIAVSTGAGELAALLASYLQHFFLLDLIVFGRTMERLSNERETGIRLFEAVAKLDADLALAKGLEDRGKICAPTFVESPHLRLRAMAHPLLDQPVTHSFETRGQSFLITGSNMCGKTTFIKSIGVNLVLARTLGFCHAEEAELPIARALTSIQREDALDQGRSYFLTELEEIGAMVDAPSDGDTLVFLIDEIFRGTNTVERIAAAASVLEHLASQGLCFVTTHDLELQDILERAAQGSFRLHHFAEQIEDDELRFDYRLRIGPGSSRNALRLLEARGYPKDIVRRARELAETTGAVGREGSSKSTAQHPPDR